MTTIVPSSGNMFDRQTDIYVIPVNTRGVMGAGLAKVAADRNPALLAWYRQQCQDRLLAAGEAIWSVQPFENATIYMLFATKDDWRQPAQIDWIVSGMSDVRDLCELAARDGPATIAIPALGCGLGGLDWREVEPIITSSLEGIDHLTVYLYSPG